MTMYHRPRQAKTTAAGCWLRAWLVQVSELQPNELYDALAAYQYSSCCVLTSHYMADKKKTANRLDCSLSRFYFRGANEF